jgi:hypothetical protein
MLRVDGVASCAAGFNILVQMERMTLIFLCGKDTSMVGFKVTDFFRLPKFNPVFHLFHVPRKLSEIATTLNC